MMTVARADVVIVISSGPSTTQSAQVMRPGAYCPPFAVQDRHAPGAAWALTALGAGAAASALVIELGRTPVAQDAHSEPDPEVVDEASHGEFAAQASR
jgi:hypothetical protein